MIYENIIEGNFIERPNRFIALVRLKSTGETVVCHVKNTGRCRELLVSECRVLLQDFSQNKGRRKTEYDLIAVYKGDMLVNMDSQAPNAVVWEWLEGLQQLRREVKYRSSRFDFSFKHGERSYFMEVKGVTLENNGVVSFPDAPTDRGIKHINELIRAVHEGYGAVILFVVQMENAEYFIPQYGIHSEFGCALKKACDEGVIVKAYCCKVTQNSISIHKEIPVRFKEDLYEK